MTQHPQWQRNGSLRLVIENGPMVICDESGLTTEEAQALACRHLGIVSDAGLRARLADWQDWALGLVGTASTLRSARKAIEQCVRDARGQTQEPR